MKKGDVWGMWDDFGILVEFVGIGLEGEREWFSFVDG